LRKILTEIAIASALFLVLSFSCYASGPGTTAANFLKIGVGEKAEILTMYNMHFQEVKQGYLSLAFPLLGGTIGLGANYVDMGKIEGRDEYGNPTEEFGASDIQVSLGYANKVSSKLMFGVSAGMLQETIAEDKKSTYVGNVGLLLIGESLSLGLACQNIGSKLGEDPLPLTYRGGIALGLGSLTLAADAVKEIDSDIYYCAGLEWWTGNFLALRAGYRTNQDIGSGISYGIGLKISKIQLDYAYVPYGDLGNTQRVSLGIKF